MNKIEILNFHNLNIKNAEVSSNPIKQTKKHKENTLSIVFIRNPYSYFDYLLSDYVEHKRSILFTKKMTQQIDKLSASDFIEWLDTLTPIPLYNPQTFQLNASKRVDVAIKNLENFDYVVPYEMIDDFLENISLDLHIDKEKEENLPFSFFEQKEHALSTKFIHKDMELYAKASELWELVKENEFKSLRLLIKPEKTVVKTNKTKYYEGIAGLITANTIRGFVFHKEDETHIDMEIYHNNVFLCHVKADKMRVDLQEKKIHPTGKCGFEVIFDKPTFKKGDKVEIKILPDNILLPLGKNAKDFLGL